MAEQSRQDMELKETVDRSRFIDLLRNIQTSLEGGQEFEVMVDNQTYTIPADVADRCKFRVEYEIDKGEYELELTMKWR
jgi:amphi-Trp domain-containing protein